MTQQEKMAQYLLGHCADSAFTYFRGDETGTVGILRKRSMQNVIEMNLESSRRNFAFDPDVVMLVELDLQVLLAVLGLRVASEADIRTMLLSLKAGNAQLPITDNADDLGRLVKKSISRLYSNGFLCRFEIDRPTDTGKVKKLYALTPQGRKLMIEKYHIPIEEINFGVLQNQREWLRSAGLAYVASTLCSNNRHGKVASFNSGFPRIVCGPAGKV